ncbi:excalibur calcium-binding domain-containing protein [Leucobacter sp.]
MVNAPAGWYSNPDDESEIRYWDGSQWTDRIGPKPHAQMHESSPVAVKQKRRVPLWVAITAGVVGLLLGSSGSIASSDKQRIGELEDQLATAQTESEKALQALEQTEDDFSEERAALILEAAEATEEVEKAQKTVEEAEQAAEEANQRALAAEAAAEEPPLSLVDTPTETSGTASAYYKNCSEARAAGAAPLYSGQPGYGSHLDRDGDGVACE